MTQQRTGILTTRRIDRVSAPGSEVRGRFAPSPTGLLHEGSLLAAVGSYLCARRAGGEWLVRIEDIDPPREVAGAADAILRQLETAGLHWDGSVCRQHARLEVYRAFADELRQRGEAYSCSCTRSEIRAHPGSAGGRRYPGSCRNGPLHPERDTATRLVVPEVPVCFDDVLQGRQRVDLREDGGDFVIHRRDGRPAYHLAVVVDDAWQGITEVVRGIDLLVATAAHRVLQHQLAVPAPACLHLPLVTTGTGEKLSKQTGAAPVRRQDIPAAVQQSLRRLGLAPPPALHRAPPAELLAWAVEVPEWHCPTNLAASVRTRPPTAAPENQLR